MTDMISTPTRSPRPLWAAIGILGATTFAMGAVLVQDHLYPNAPVTAQTPSALGLSAAVAPVGDAALVAFTPSHVQAQPPMVPALTQKRSLAPAKTAQAAIKTVAHKSQPVVVAGAPVAVASGWPAQTPVVTKVAQPVCAYCGTVEGVTPLQRDAAEGSGIGVVAGAVLGGLVGNQFGGGTGKTVSTIVGAVGGGWAGNAVEKRMKKETVYQIDLRMDDGSRQRIEHSSPLSVGSHVTVEGGTIRAAARSSAPSGATLGEV